MISNQEWDSSLTFRAKCKHLTGIAGYSDGRAEGTYVMYPIGAEGSLYFNGPSVGFR